MGSAPLMRSASTWSVTTMEPSSAAMPAPTRVASGNAPTDAAMSRTSSWTNVAPTKGKIRKELLRLQPGLEHDDRADEGHRHTHEEQAPVANLVHLFGDGAFLPLATDDEIQRACA